MEKTYYPSVRKILLHSYLYPSLMWIIGHLAGAAFAFYRKGVFDENDLLRLSSFLFAIFPIILIQGLFQGFTGKLLAIKLTPKSISGPLHVGRDMPIQFSEIDFEKTHKTKRICSIHGDELKFEAKLFEEEDVDEIWNVLSKHEKKVKSEVSL
ncbi:MAG: hypothetical protein JNJ43_11365 [Anaerolineales bacterium]|nr:hypothetical protein [Anaerolineales bacterium]